MRRDNSSDSKLWSRFKNGDKEAFSKLYRQYAVQLISYGSRICNDHFIVQDCIQDLFVELWNSREQLAQVDSIHFYFLKALRYKLIRFEKKQYVQQPQDLSTSLYSVSAVEDPFETELIEKETQNLQIKAIQKAVFDLTKRQQEVIQLRFYQGFSNAEIAELMNLNYQSVSNLLYGALRSIRRNLKKPVFSSVFVAAFHLIF